MRKSTKVFAALAGAAMVVVGGSAYTNTNTIPDTMAAYGVAEVDGAAIESVVHNFNATGDRITSTVLTFAEPETYDGKTVKAAFNTLDLIACSAVEDNVATCTWSGDGQTTSTAEQLRVLVSD